MNSDNNLSSIVLDEEFENLIKPLSPIEMHRLQFIVMSTGFAQVRVWQNIVLCDSSVYKLCLDHRFSYEVVNKGFATRYEALAYVCTEELKRDDLTYEYRRYLIGKIFNVEKKGSNSLKVTKMSISQKIGDEYSISPGAVQKYGFYADAIDHLFIVTPDLARLILEDKLRISHESTIELARSRKEELLIILQISKENNGRMTFSDIKHEIRWKNYTASSSPHSRVRKNENVEIKKMPQYDPDADIMGIALTIPSWIKALKRAVEHTNMQETTKKGRDALREQLYELDDAVIRVINTMEV